MTNLEEKDPCVFCTGSLWVTSKNMVVCTGCAVSYCRINGAWFLSHRSVREQYRHKLDGKSDYLPPFLQKKEKKKA